MDAAQAATSLEWKDIVPWLFCGGWSCIGIYVANSLRQMSDSVQQLNVNVAVVIEKVGNHEKRIERLEDKRNDSP